MSKCVENSLHWLYVLANCDKKTASFILKRADRELICAILEIFHNIYEGSIILTETPRKAVRKKHKILSKLAQKTKNIKKKQKLMVSSPELLNLILPKVLLQINGS